MKKTLITLAAILMIGSTASAQEEQNNKQMTERHQFNPEMAAKRQTDQVVKELGLNEEQAAALLKLNTERMSQMTPQRGPIEKNDSLQPRQRPSKQQMEEMRAKMEEQRNAYNEEVKKILTEEQYTKFESMQKNKRFGGRRQHRGGPRDGSFKRGQVKAERMQTTEE